MKRVLVVAPGPDYLKEPSFRLRLAALAEPLERRGYELHLRPRPGTPVGRFFFARSAGNYDAVILHRRWLDPYEARALRGAAKSPAKILMDIDDATMYHETELRPMIRRRLDRRVMATYRILNCACTGNEYLAKIFRDRGVATRVIPTVVDPSKYPSKSHAKAAEVRLVWLGSKSTLKFLEDAMPDLAAAREQVPGLRLVVVCDLPPGVQTPLPVEFVPWRLDAEASALLKGDIGIAPTPENRWTLGKCGFKIVQYMAAGLPVIASPVGMNIDLTRPENGLLAASPAEWVAAIRTLAANAERRNQLGGAGRARVESELNIEKAADAWAEALA